MKILISAGPTREALDPVRFITNHSSGKMGYALAESARDMGYEVTLVSGPVNLPPPAGVKVIHIVSAADMAAAVKGEFAAADLTIMAAAVADYRPKAYSPGKIKKKEGDLVLELERTEDILASLGKLKQPGQILMGFAAETDDLLANAQSKMVRKNLDWIAANLVGVKGQGFAADDNAITLLGRNGEKIDFKLQNKADLAQKLLQTVLKK